jgi:hypothetical protein
MGRDIRLISRRETPTPLRASPVQNPTSCCRSKPRPEPMSTLPYQIRRLIRSLRRRVHPVFHGGLSVNAFDLFFPHRGGAPRGLPLGISLGDALVSLRRGGDDPGAFQIIHKTFYAVAVLGAPVRVGARLRRLAARRLRPSLIAANAEAVQKPSDRGVEGRGDGRSELEISVRRAIEPTTRAIVVTASARRGRGGHSGRRALGTEAEEPHVTGGGREDAGRARRGHGRARAERERGRGPRDRCDGGRGRRAPSSARETREERPSRSSGGHGALTNMISTACTYVDIYHCELSPVGHQRVQREEDMGVRHRFSVTGDPSTKNRDFY